MAELPKNITLVSYENADGTRQLKYRVRLQVKKTKFNQLFDDLNEAKQYLIECKSKYGSKTLTKIEKEEAEALKSLNEFKNELTFEFCFNTYFNYRYPKKEFQVSLLKKKQYATYKSFFKTILNTDVSFLDQNTLENTPHAAEIMDRFNMGRYISSKPKRLGDFKIREVDYIVINSYVLKRLALGKSKITVRKELSIISCFYQEIKFIPVLAKKNVENLGNPTKEINKKLLQNAHNNEKAKRIDDENFEKIKTCIYCEDLDFAYTLLLQYYGALRMSEAIYLQWSDINFKEKKIRLPQTKTLPRTVYMSKDLEDLLNTIEDDPDKRTGLVVKTQTYYKYQKQIQRFRKKYDFDLVSHQLRKDAISRLIEKVGTNNSIVLSEILGFTNVKNFETNYLEDEPNLDSIEGVMKNVGHTENSKNITKNKYFGFKSLK